MRIWVCKHDDWRFLDDPLCASVSPDASQLGKVMIRGDSVVGERRICVFQADGYLPAGDAAALQGAGQVFAAHLVKQLQSCSQVSDCVGPFPEEFGWYRNATINDMKFLVQIYATPIGLEAAERWVLQFDLERGLLKRLFGRRPSGIELEPIYTALRPLVGLVPGVSEIKWLTEDEFRAAL